VRGTHSLARSLFLLRARNSQAVKQQASGKRAASTQARCMHAEVGVERTQQWGGYAMRYREWRGGGEKGSVTSQKRTAAKQSCNRVPAWW